MKHVRDRTDARTAPHHHHDRIPALGVPFVKVPLLAMLIACSHAAFAQALPQPPCGVPPVPAHAQAGQQPNIQVWSQQQLASWTPPPCLGWSRGARDLVVAISGTFADKSGGRSGAGELLSRFGAISTMRGIKYWSVTDKDWRILITDASAATGEDAKTHRPDFRPGELKPGRDVYFIQADSRSTGHVTYRMRVREAEPDRIVLELENVTPVRLLFVTLFKPGGMRFDYFLQRRANGLWTAYGLLAVASSRTSGNEASFVNRLVAFYRHFVGDQPDGAPPPGS
jgi:hypothetical protein